MTDNNSIIESVVIGGDLSKLTPEQRVGYYKAVCDSLRLNPLTKPFDYIQLNGKLTLYAKKDAADQLRNIHDISITRLERERIDTIYTVTAYAQDKTGRQDSSIGAVNIENLKGDALANAIMKAETKSKRRVTLSICGLGMLDETELETIKDIQPAKLRDKIYAVSANVETTANTETVITDTTGEMKVANIPANLLPVDEPEKGDWVDRATNSEGVLLIDIPTHKLAPMFNSLANTLKKPDLSPAEREAKQKEKDAIEIILAERNSKPIKG